MPSTSIVAGDSYNQIEGENNSNSSGNGSTIVKEEKRDFLNMLN